jgi:hypothetical protein
MNKAKELKVGVMRLALLKAMMKFTDSYRSALRSVAKGSNGSYVSTDTFTLVIVGETPESCIATNPDELKLEIARAAIYKEDVDFGRVGELQGTYPKVGAIVKDMVPVMALDPNRVRSICDTAIAAGSQRIHFCLMPGGDGRKPCGFAFKDVDFDLPVQVILMPIEPETGVTLAHYAVTGGTPLIKEYRAKTTVQEGAKAKETDK